MKLLLTAFVLFICLVPAAAATFTVNKLADTNDGACNADCSLREAVAQANSSPGDDTIVFDAAVFAGSQKITLAAALGDLAVTDTTGALAIGGPGAARLAVSGGNLVRVFNVAAGANLSLDRLTVTEGKAPSRANGGGILNAGTLTVTRSAITASTSDFFGGGICNVAGASLTVAGSTISGNSAAGSTALGGGIAAGGNVAVTNSTISNNTASASVGNGSGGGIYYVGPGTIGVTNSAIFGNTVIGGNGGSGGGGGFWSNSGTSNLTNTTISGNSASSIAFYGLGGGVLGLNGTLNITNCTITGNSTTGNANNSGGGIISGGTINVRNTIVAGNSNTSAASNGPDVSGSFVSLGNNLIGKTDGTTAFTQPTDRTGTAAAPLDARLGPLGLYGGLTMTFPLLSGSPAIDNGNSCVADLSCAANNPSVAIASDQRGAGRVGATDIGAFEASNTLNGGTFRGRLPDAILNQSYSQTLIPEAAGASVCLAGGALPAGISGLAPCLTGLRKENADFAPAAPVTLAGTPTVGGNYSFTVQVTQGGNSAQINYLLPAALAPTAASVDVGGRVATNTGRAVANATVTLTTANGETLSVRTNSFGYYKFAGIESGRTVILTVRAKGLEFAPQIVNLTDSLADLDLTAL